VNDNAAQTSASTAQSEAKSSTRAHDPWPRRANYSYRAPQGNTTPRAKKRIFRRPVLLACRLFKVRLVQVSLVQVRLVQVRLFQWSKRWCASWLRWKCVRYKFCDGRMTTEWVRGYWVGLGGCLRLRGYAISVARGGGRKSGKPLFKTC